MIDGNIEVSSGWSEVVGERNVYHWLEFEGIIRQFEYLFVSWVGKGRVVRIIKNLCFDSENEMIILYDYLLRSSCNGQK